MVLSEWRKQMKEMIHTKNWKRVMYFVIGLIATVAYRIILFTGEMWTKVMWYVGTLGFVLYFWHRAEVQQKRADLVSDNDLIRIVSGMKKLKVEQKQALNYLVRTSVTSKARWNSLMIFWLSLVALVVGAVYDFVL
jgi:hypothetical protein